MERRYGDRVPEVSHCSKKGVISCRTENGFSLPWRGGTNEPTVFMECYAMVPAQRHVMSNPPRVF
jgi:hypothetical protein